MTEIHPSALVHPGACLGEGIRVGPGAVIGEAVRLGEQCEVGAGAVVEGPAEIGPRCRIFPGAVVGAEAQVVNLEGPGGGVEIGPGTVLREMATVHRSMYEGRATRVGANCYIMVYAHVAHDCVLGDRVIFANSTAVAGHVRVDDDCFITGFVGVHQFSRIGEGAFVVGPCAVRQDVLPFTMVEGHPPRVRGLNVEGLRRRGVAPEIRGHLKRAYRIVLGEVARSGEAVERIEGEIPLGREIRAVIDFLRSSKRGFVRGRV